VALASREGAGTLEVGGDAIHQLPRDGVAGMATDGVGDHPVEPVVGVRATFGQHLVVGPRDLVEPQSERRHDAADDGGEQRGKIRRAERSNGGPDAVLWPMRQGWATTLGGMIAAQLLSKRYDGALVVDDVTFTCQRGTVTGFLGPNGAGKSTTLPMITGLTRPDHGHATVAGVPFVALPNPSPVVGTLLDASAMHPGRSGRNTLAVAAHMAAVPQHRVDEVLATVGLSAAAADKRVGTYSLGMLQRLGIAQPSSAALRCSSWTNRPTASTPKASPGCANWSATSPTKAAPCCCPATSSPKSKRRSTASS
jgi:ABC-type transport system involved in cytochrome c biogenesis ATPase subunit